MTAFRSIDAPVYRAKIDLYAVLREIGKQHQFTRPDEPYPDDGKKLLAEELRKAQALRSFANLIQKARTVEQVFFVLCGACRLAERANVWTGV